MQHKIYSFLLPVLATCLLVLTGVSAQSPLIGNWEGTITVERDGEVLSSFKMLLTISSDSLEVQGQSWVWYNEKKAVFSFRGRMEKEVLKIKDIALLEYDKLPSGEWCYKVMELRLSQSRKHAILEGLWTGNTTFSSCQPGRIMLKKIMKRA